MEVILEAPELSIAGPFDHVDEHVGNHVARFTATLLDSHGPQRGSRSVWCVAALRQPSERTEINHAFELNVAHLYPGSYLAVAVVSLREQRWGQSCGNVGDRPQVDEELDYLGRFEGRGDR